MGGECKKAGHSRYWGLGLGLALWCAGLVGVAGAATITEFNLTGNGYISPEGITAGPDGALWFTEVWNGTKIGRITTPEAIDAGTIKEFRLPTLGSPHSITAGPDGALWFTTATEFTGGEDCHNVGEDSYRAGIGRITTAGAITGFALPTVNSRPSGITAGPDGALWFTEFRGSKIGRITTAGTITEFSLPTASSFPGAITAGPDGALWFTEPGANKIGRIVPDLSAAVLLNGSAFHTGQQITYQATLNPGFTPTQVDIYLGALLPDGRTFLSLIEVSPGVISIALGPSPIPFRANVTLTQAIVPFSYTFAGFEPAGTCVAYAGLAVAGSDPFQPANQLSLSVQAFQFNP